MELRSFRTDFHIHTCLSPCGELTIYPSKIVERAIAQGLEIIAVADHNTAENAAATMRAARGTGLTVFPGMELTSEEEVHILAVFERIEDLLPVQEEVYRGLPSTPVRPSFLENQVIVDAEDAVVGFLPRNLLAATELNVYEIVDLIHRRRGLAIASHIDRGAFSIVTQLGFVPPDIALDALEVSPRMTIEAARAAYGAGPRLPLVRFSDAHAPEDIGRTWTGFLIAAPGLEEIRMALAGEKRTEDLLPVMEDLSLHVLDIAENAIAAGASRIVVLINENDARNVLTIRVVDNGRGLAPTDLGRVLDPFYSTKGKRTGLGLPLLAQAAGQCGGGMTMTSAPGRGTTVTARFRLRHIDRPPLTNMAGTMAVLVLGHTEIDFRYRHRRNGRVFRFESRRLFAGRDLRGGIDPGLVGSVRRELRSGLERIGGT